MPTVSRGGSFWTKLEEPSGYEDVFQFHDARTRESPFQTFRPLKHERAASGCNEIVWAQCFYLQQKGRHFPIQLQAPQSLSLSAAAAGWRGRATSLLPVIQKVTRIEKAFSGSQRVRWKVTSSAILSVTLILRSPQVMESHILRFFEIFTKCTQAFPLFLIGGKGKERNP